MPPVIEVKHLIKEYSLGTITSVKDTVRHFLARLSGKKTWHRENFKALDDVNFSIEKGEVVGIIGHNGAGKSTLLKHLAHITTPTSGEVIVLGSVAPLIEVGAGVNPELTGRENIYLNGAILGIPKKVIHKKIDEIIAFAELERFIDTPVKRYSSGMKIKLGFSIATSMDADILIVDEVLAVGDLAFQRKCFDRMENLIKNSSRTVLLVSHNIRQIQRLCSRVIMLDKGQVILDGPPNEACDEFYKRNNRRIIGQKTAHTDNKYFPSSESSGEIDIKEIIIKQNGKEMVTREVSMHSTLGIGVKFEGRENLRGIEVVVGVHTTDFFYIMSASSKRSIETLNFRKGCHYIECSISDLCLTPGVYGLRLAFLDASRRIMWYGENLLGIQVNAGSTDLSTIPSLGIVDIPFDWTTKAY